MHQLEFNFVLPELSFSRLVSTVNHDSAAAS